ncbi:MAG: hypothetical protein J6Q65_05000 [Lentisphaeria bacterium]|nr:hypothetical protein [Lentisphaeria bacterium]
MMKFEVGKSYYPQDRGYDPVEVIKRTDKSIRVKRWYDGSEWMMRIRTDSAGNEMCTDSTAPKKWRFVFTYCADEPVEEST